MKIEIIIKPNSKEQRIEKLTENAYKVLVKSPPRDSKANKEMIDLLANHFKIHKNQVEIVFGWKSRRKFVEIKNDNFRFL